MCHWLTLTLFSPPKTTQFIHFRMLSNVKHSEKGTCSWEKIMEFDFRYGCVTSSCYNVERACCSCVLLFTLNSQLFVPNDKRHRRPTDNDDVCARDEIYVSQNVSMSRRGAGVAANRADNNGKKCPTFYHFACLNVFQIMWSPSKGTAAWIVHIFFSLSFLSWIMICFLRIEYFQLFSFCVDSDGRSGRSSLVLVCPCGAARHIYDFNV